MNEKDFMTQTNGLKAELEKLLDSKESFWRHKARANWLKLGLEHNSSND